MTKEQREILVNLVEGEADGHGYTIVTVEYPCSTDGNMKVVTRQWDNARRENFMYVDVYGADGRTISTESQPA